MSVERDSGKWEALREQVGQADFDELQRVVAWITARPTRHELSAYLLDQLQHTQP